MRSEAMNSIARRFAPGGITRNLANLNRRGQIVIVGANADICSHLLLRVGLNRRWHVIIVIVVVIINIAILNRSLFFTSENNVAVVNLRCGAVNDLDAIQILQRCLFVDSTANVDARLQTADVRTVALPSHQINAAETTFSKKLTIMYPARQRIVYKSGSSREFRYELRHPLRVLVKGGKSQQIRVSGRCSVHVGCRVSQVFVDIECGGEVIRAYCGVNEHVAIE